MFAPDRILTLDVGASKILLGEFSLKGGMPVLVNYAEAERDPLEATGENGLSLLAPTVREMMTASGIKPAPLYLMLSGQAVFPRFVKIPGATADMADALVSAEAAESLPFPLDQVVWDYQTLDDATGTGELEALIVATKAETAADAAALAEGAGLSLALVDAAPLALCNAVRASLPEGDESCTLALDIGAKATTLLFVEGKKVFLRTIPVAGNTVTNEISRALGISAEEAESVKKEIGFVALGGTYAVEDDERADRVSKVIRNVATRLHSEITRSINFYRSQQGGNAPERVLLCGGSSLTRHLDTFFREKLGVEISYLDAFSSVVGATDALRGDEGALFAMATSAGLALRAAGKASLEIDLVPAELAAERRFKGRIPFFAASLVLLLVSVAVLNVHSSKVSAAYEDVAEFAARKQTAAEKAEKNLNAVKREDQEEQGRFDYLRAVASSRTSFSKAVDAIRRSLLPGTWIQSLSFDVDSEDRSSGDEASAGTARLVVCGFKPELDELAANKGSAGEILLTRLRKTSVFSDSGGSVEREIPLHNDRVTEITLSLSLSRRPGRIDSAWVPPSQKEASRPAAGDAGGDEDGQEG